MLPQLLPGGAPGGAASKIRILLLVSFLFSILLVPPSAAAKERRGEVTVAVNIAAPAGARQVRLWIPYPMSDEYQEITGIAVRGNYSSAAVLREGSFGNAILFVEWNSAGGERRLEYSFQVRRKEVVTKPPPGPEQAVWGREVEKFLKPSPSLPTGGEVKKYAEKIVGGKKTVREKAAAVYGWIVENMYRDPAVKGCGLGEVEMLLTKKGGKCADIHSVFVALARAAGVPAREVFGIRLPAGKEGDMTKAQHCWAEYYQPGYGWVAVDPADVRKAMLEKKLTLEQAKPLREYYFGAVDENRIAFGTGRDIRLNPPQAGEPLNYFMYPYAEADGRPLNEDLFGFNLGYTIYFREL